jgi:hypothetical protein
MTFISSLRANFLYTLKAYGYKGRTASCSYAYPEACIEVIHVRAATHPDLVGITIRDGLNRLRPNAHHYQRE